MDAFIDVDRLKSEIATIKQLTSYRARPSLRRASGASMYPNSERLSVLLQWAQTVCGCYGLEVRAAPLVRAKVKITVKYAVGPSLSFCSIWGF